MTTQVVTTSDSANSTPTPRIMTMAAAIKEALDTALTLDERVFELGEDIHDPKGGGWKIHQGLSTKHGAHRVRNTPISEQAIVGAAVGAAITGMRPVAEIMLMNFISVAADQLINHAAKLRYMSGGQTKVPMVLRTATGAGGSFGAQHSDMLESPLLHTAGLKVVVPSTARDAKGLLLTSILDEDDPVVFVEMQRLYYSAKDDVPEGDYRIPLGKLRVAREGTDLTVVTWGRQVHDAVKLADRLAEDEGIETEVIDLRSLWPLDKEGLLERIGRTKRAVVLHEAIRRNGYGAELAATIHEELWGTLESPVRRVAAVDTPVPYAKGLEAEYLPHEGRIESAIRSVLEK